MVIGGLYDFNISMDGMEAIVPARFLFTVEGNGRARAHHRPPFGQDNRERVNPAHLHKSTCAGLRNGCQCFVAIAKPLPMTSASSTKPVAVWP